MTVLRQRHKNMILAGVIGFLLALVCVIFVYIIGVQNNPKVAQWLIDKQKNIEHDDKNYDGEEMPVVLTKAYVFTKVIEEDDNIREDDVMETMIDQRFLPEGVIKNAEEFIGKKIKCKSTPNMILTSTLVYEEKEQGDVKERIEVLNLHVPEFIQEMERINLRIHYPTGQDFIVLKDVYMTKIYEERQGATLELNHDEIVSLSSAKEDVNMYPGTVMYYTKDKERYTRGFIGEVLRNSYPVNPNTIGFLTSHYNEETVYKERKELDTTLSMFFDEETDVYSFTGIEAWIEEEKIAKANAEKQESDGIKENEMDTKHLEDDLDRIEKPTMETGDSEEINIIDENKESVDVKIPDETESVSGSDVGF